VILFISILVLFLVVTVFAGAGGLFLALKLFKAENLSYKKSLIIFIAVGVVDAVVDMIVNFILPGAESIFIFIASFVVLAYFLRKHYQMSWGKSAAIYFIHPIITLPAYMILVFVMYSFVGQVFVVVGSSMDPTYNNSDVVLVNMLDKKFDRGEVLIFNPPNDSDYQISRVVGLPLEKISIREGQVWINDSLVSENYSDETTPGDISITLEENQYFVMGDNRGSSFDSRNFGPISKSNILGSVFYKIYSASY